MLKKLNYDHFYFTLGVIGAVFVLIGYTQITPHKFIIIGSFLLLITAIHFKMIYFIALECILLACYFSSLRGISFYTQVALPILLCVQLFIFYYMLGKQNNLVVITGIIGIALLSVGFASKNQWFYITGCSGVAVYSYFSAVNKRYPSYIWAVLNTCLILFSLFNLLQFHLRTSI